MRYSTLTLIVFFTITSFAQAPTLPATSLLITNIKCNQFDVSWANGNGTERVVFIRELSPFTNTPEDNFEYIGNPVFGMGDAIKNDNTHFCVYKGPGSFVTVTGLKNKTMYHIAVFEFNGGGGGGNTEYLTTFYPEVNYLTKNSVASFTVSPGQCINGNSFQFTNKSSSDITPYNLMWYFGDGDSSNQLNPKHTYKTAGVNKVKLNLTAQGCNASVTLNDTVYPRPIPKFYLDHSVPKNDSIQCFYNNQFTFINKTTMADIGAGPSSIVYYWYLNGGSYSNGFKTAIKSPYPGVQTIKLVAISNRGCRDSFTQTYKILSRNIDPSKVSVSPKSMYLKNNQFAFKNTSPLSISHKWFLYKKNNKVSFDSVPGSSVNYTFKETGWFYVTLASYDNGGCLDKHTDSVEVIKDLGVSQYAQSNISIYPNPSKSGIYTIDNLSADATLKVYSIFGQELLNLNTQASNAEINLSRFEAGTYIMILSSEDKTYSFKLMKL